MRHSGRFYHTFFIRTNWRGKRGCSVNWYNLPFLTALIALAVHAKSTNLQVIMAAAPGPAIIFVAIALLLSIPARLRSNPFSIPNAESEIVAGIYTEYNSKPLAVLNWFTVWNSRQWWDFWEYCSCRSLIIQWFP